MAVIETTPKFHAKEVRLTYFQGKFAFFSSVPAEIDNCNAFDYRLTYSFFIRDPTQNERNIFSNMASGPDFMRQACCVENL